MSSPAAATIPSLAQARSELAAWAAQQAQGDQALLSELLEVIDAVVSVLHPACEAWHKKCRKIAQAMNANPFRDALAPSLGAPASYTRSFDSSHGNWIEKIAYVLIQTRFGARASHVFTAPGVAAKTTRGKASKTVDVWTAAPRAIVEERAEHLLTLIEGGAKIGSAAFAHAFKAAIAVVHAAPTVEPWCLHADAAIKADGFYQMKAGGNLDESKAPAEIRKLLRVALAYGDPETPPRFAVCYANRGEGKRPDGALTRYFEWSWSQKDPPLLIGSQWWRHVLPERVGYKLFIALYKEAGRVLPFDPIDPSGKPVFS